MTTKRPIRCAIYTRKSTEEGLEQDFNSLDAQREACGAYITSQKAEGWSPLHARYDDGGYSGGTLERPALKQLLADIETGKIDVIVVYKIDRLSRSLMDFAKLVEVFDRKGVTFVSVTQSFNTTTSMGRLTLNVLLSFAQFEREVTGERIRDKIAASKKKGIWMGGNPPLGYDVGDRKLVVNPVEAETVRLIFRRYLELGCARLLCADLAERGFVSKRRTFADGRRAGGKPIGQSAVCSMLKNRIYIGETHHKGHYYRGEHDAIVPRPLFDAVQTKLAEHAPPLSGKKWPRSGALYADLLFDETGAAMVPNYTIKRGGARYRYYVSRPVLKGGRSTASISRIPAAAFEAFVSEVMARLGFPLGDQHSQIRAVAHRIDVLARSIVVHWNKAELIAAWREACADNELPTEAEIIDGIRARLSSGEEISDDGDYVILTLPVRARFRGGKTSVVFPAGAIATAPKPDIALIKAIARAHRWKRLLLEGEFTSTEEIARRGSHDRRHAARTLALAFLSPALVKAILVGTQPVKLRLGHLLEADLPLSWQAQEAIISALAERARP